MKMKNMKKELLVFFILLAVVSVGNGLSDQVFANYFKDAYNVNATQRAFIEFPRELPGMICVFVIAALSFLGDIKIAIIAQIFSFIGIAILGLTDPSFNMMMVFLFINSLGMHVFMPLNDSIGMALAEEGDIGRRVGQYGSLKTAVFFLTGLFVFFGFRSGFLTFQGEFKLIFVISAVAFLIAAILATYLYKITKEKNLHFKKKTSSLVFKKEYKYYYFLTILHGVQKQIAYVFGSWVIIDLLSKGVEVMSILTIIGSFLGIFFFRFVGHLMDQKGIKFVMYIDALSFIFIYVIYGFIVYTLEGQSSITPIYVGIVYLLYILDRLSMQVGVVKAVYLRDIAIDKSEVTSVLSTGLTLDHFVAIIAAQFSGLIWVSFGAHWVFFIAALFSLGNLYVAYKIK